MIGQGMEERKLGPTWIRPDLKKERGEIERVIYEFLGKEPNEQNIKEVIAALESAPLLDLSDQDWKLLENTDSQLGNVRLGHIKDAEQITEKYNLELAPENRRDFKKLLEGFQGGNMEAPNILRDASGRLHLISGNTRLMISRALNIRPKVVIGTLV